MNYLPKLSYIYFLGLCFVGLSIFGCEGDSKEPFAVTAEPILSLISKQDTANFSIVLHDMDMTEDETKIFYRHKYLIVNPAEDQMKLDSTDWVNVSKGFFDKHQKDLGMELVSRHDGPISTVVKPFGFDWAIGNEKYGEWVVDSTSTTASSTTSSSTTSNTGTHERRWHYHSGSNFLFYYWMFSRPTYYGSYNRYGSSYRGRTPYYGSGRSTYGTSSPYQRANRSSFYSRKASSKTWSRKTRSSTRSSSRYSGGSRTRGRSGGSGK